MRSCSMVQSASERSGLAPRLDEFVVELLLPWLQNSLCAKPSHLPQEGSART